MPRILLLNQVFFPDVAATAQHAHDLARHLVAHGHEVHVIASRSIYGARGAALPARERIDGIEIHRVGRSLFGKASIAARVVDFGLFYAAAAFRAMRIPRPDVVVCFTTPPFIALVGWMLRLLRGSRFVYWVMDLYPDLPIACGVMKPRGVVSRFFETINRFCLGRADRTVVLGRCMLERVREKGITGDHVVRIGVWADPQEVTPLPREGNPCRAEWGLGNRFTVMYSGNFGLGHDVATMCEAALRLRDDDRIRFVFAGGGKRKAEVERFVAEHELGNVVVAPYQPRERLDAVLSAGDLHLATLKEGVEGIMVPCKLFGIMAAERPAVFIGDPRSELARTLTEHECGVCVREGDVDGLVAVIRELAADPQRCAVMGRRGRAALSSEFSRERSCTAWRELLEELAGGADVPVKPPASHAASTSGGAERC